MGESKGLGETLDNLPTWLYFGLIILAMAYITLNPLGFPIPVTQLTRDCYNQVDALQPGDIMLIDFGYSGGTLALMEPGYVVVMRHAIEKGARAVIVSSGAEAPSLFARAMDFIDPDAKGFTYGEDYVYLGFFSGAEAAYAGILEDIGGVFTEDFYGTPTSQIPLMTELSSPTHEKIKLAVIYTAGGDVIEGWIRQISVRYGIPLITEVNEMMVPTILPYYPINCAGILNGGVGAAEYEAFSGYAGEAIKLSDMLTMGGLVVLIFLILGNIGFYMKGGRQ